jgi:WhiB family transcriptional regulator, redox-sensing transcriptional regulator
MPCVGAWGMVRSCGARTPTTGPTRELCEGCPVRQECLEVTLANSDLVGLWSGTTDPERREIRRRRVAQVREFVQQPSPILDWIRWDHLDGLGDVSRTYAERCIPTRTRLNPLVCMTRKRSEVRVLYGPLPSPQPSELGKRLRGTSHLRRVAPSWPQSSSGQTI